MEAPRGIGGRRTLLPFEVQLIDQLGISVEEYWQFNDAALERIQQREQGYELIPEIYNEPTTIIAVASLVIGLASTAVGLLMKPKPPKPQSNNNERINAERGDNIGRSRYNPRYGFDSVQELATLGKPIPLIFTRRGKFGYGTGNSPVRISTGGTRISTQLVWSMLMSAPHGQELRIAAMIGLGGMEWRPEYEGYSIGSSKLEGYTQTKVFLTYNENGDRPKPNNQAKTYTYPEGQLYEKQGKNPPLDTLLVDLISKTEGDRVSRPADSGTNSPNTSTVFGLSNFAPNGTGFRQPYKAIVVPYNNHDGIKVSTEETRDALRMEDLKFNKYLYPRGSGFTKIRNQNGSNVTPDVKDNADALSVGVERGYTLEYTIGVEILPGASTEEDSMFKSQKVEDVNQVADASRADVDDLLNVGETYRISNFDAICLYRDPEDEPPYEGRLQRRQITYVFEVLSDRGYIKMMDQFREGRIFGNAYNDRIEYGSDLRGKVDDRSDIEDKRQFGNNHPCDCSFISEINEAVVSMTRPTNVLEIGIKSQVWRKIQGPNVADYPGDAYIEKLAQSGSTVQLGQLDRYMRRYSFFRLHYRKAGFGLDPEEAGNDWDRVLDADVVFCVQGSTPRDQYNYIKIKIGDNNFDQLYEFRLEPVSGAVMDWKIYNANEQSVRVAMFSWEGNKRVQNPVDIRSSLAARGWEVAFNGTMRSLSLAELEIIDTQLGPFVKGEGKGKVVSLDRYNNGLPPVNEWVTVDKRYSDPSQVFPADLSRKREKVTRRVASGGKFEWEIWWDNQKLYDQVLDHSNRRTFNKTIGQYRYKAGPEQAGNPVNGLERYQVIQQEQVVGSTPNITTVKEHKNRLSGSGFEIKIYAYQDPDDPDDNTGRYAYWEIHKAGSGYKDGEVAEFDIRGVEERITIRTEDLAGREKLYKRPVANDYPFYEGETISCDTSPEHEVVYINQINPYDDGVAPNFANLAYATLHLKAGREFTSFSDFSAYIKRGLMVKRLVSDSIVEQNYEDNDYRNQDGTESKPLPERYASNLLPEIACALLTDPDLGVGEIVGGYQVEYNSMIKSANYCLANGFTWDGIIVDRVNLRDWIYQNAVFNLLDFVVKGGRFGLIPALLYSPTSYRIDPFAKPPIVALFTDGNMKGYKATYLQPEDRQLFTAVVLYRYEVGNGQATNYSLTVNFTQEQGGRPGIDPVEEFNMSDSVTSPAHAEAFAKFALRVRKHVTHTIEFSTTVNEVLGVEPGQYIKVTTEAHYHPLTNKSSMRFKNGSIGPDGQVTSNVDLHGQTIDIFYWQSGDEEGVREARVSVDDNGYITDAKLFRSVFTVNDAEVQTRVYRINSITYGEEGFVDVTATHTPLTDSGALKVADWNEDDFVVTLNG